jgi:hypothetical protein
LVGVGGWFSGPHLGFVKEMSPCALLGRFVEDTEILQEIGGGRRKVAADQQMN